MDTFLLLYIGLAMIHLSLRSEGLKNLGSLTKVLLMPLLMMYVLKNGAKPLLLCSLALATVGDYFLTKASRKNTFTLGMISFALAHLCYSMHILLTPLQWLPIGIGLLLVLAPFFYLLKLLKYSPFKIRYILYAVNLFAMTVLCFGSGSMLASLGALAFIISDGMIAMGSLNRHQCTVTTEMAMYILAQLLLILGLVTL